jgi:hypothetical protein
VTPAELLRRLTAAAEAFDTGPLEAERVRAALDVATKRLQTIQETIKDSEGRSLEVLGRIASSMFRMRELANAWLGSPSPFVVQVTAEGLFWGVSGVIEPKQTVDVKIEPQRHIPAGAHFEVVARAPGVYIAEIRIGSMSQVGNQPAAILSGYLGEAVPIGTTLLFRVYRLGWRDDGRE